MRVDADRRLHDGLRWHERLHQAPRGANAIAIPSWSSGAPLCLDHAGCERPACGHCASPARRTPAKICRRRGRSQLRKCALGDAGARWPRSRRAARGRRRRRRPPSTRGRDARRSRGIRGIGSGSTPTPSHPGERAGIPSRRARLRGRFSSPGRRLLPLGLGGQARAVRSREGVGLEPADMAGGRLLVARRKGGVGGDLVLLLPRPALGRPPLAPLIPAVVCEAHPARAADRVTGDAEGGRLDGVARALVVVGEPVLRGAHRERPGRDLHPPPVLGGAARAAARPSPAPRAGAVPRWRASGASSRSAEARGAAPSRTRRRRRARGRRSPRWCGRAPACR